MPIPLGVLAVAGAGGGVAAGNAYEWLETTVLGSSTDTVTFSNLNSTYGSTYQHLQVRVVWKTDQGSGTQIGRLRFNGDTSNSYATHWIRGNGTNVASASRTTGNNADGFIYMQNAVPSSATADNFAGMVLDILDPFETTKYTTVRTLYGETNIYLLSGLWINTAALTSINFDSDGSFLTGSRFSLYGLRSA